MMIFSEKYKACFKCGHITYMGDPDECQKCGHQTYRSALLKETPEKTTEYMKGLKICDNCDCLAWIGHTECLRCGRDNNWRPLSFKEYMKRSSMVKKSKQLDGRILEEINLRNMDSILNARFKATRQRALTDYTTRWGVAKVKIYNKYIAIRKELYRRKMNLKFKIHRIGRWFSRRWINHTRWWSRRWDSNVGWWSRRWDWCVRQFHDKPKNKFHNWLEKRDYIENWNVHSPQHIRNRIYITTNNNYLYEKPRFLKKWWKIYKRPDTEEKEEITL